MTTLMPRRWSCRTRKARKSVEALVPIPNPWAQTSQDGCSRPGTRDTHRVGGAVRLMAQPPIPTRLIGLGLPSAGEGHVLVAEPGGMSVLGADIVGYRRLSVILRRPLEPPSSREEITDVLDVGGGRGVVGRPRQEVRVAEHGDQDLVQIGL